METHLPDMDRKLLDAISDGHADAFETLFNRYWEDLYAQAYRRLRDQGEAEDMVQDIFADLWLRRDRLDVKTSFAAYLRRALKYRIIKWASRAELHKVAMDHLLHRMEEMEDTILSAISAGEISKTMAQALETFPENMRRVFLLRAEDYSVAEIAEALGLAEQTVKNNTAEALRRMRTALFQKHPHIHKSIYALLVLLTES